MGAPVSAEPAVYASGFNHERERQNYYRLVSLVDRPASVDARATPAEPQFFSENIASLSVILAPVRSATMVIRREGGLERQTVRYELAH
jgi:hypothetical protein